MCIYLPRLSRQKRRGRVESLAPLGSWVFWWWATEEPIPFGPYRMLEYRKWQSVQKCLSVKIRIIQKPINLSNIRKQKLSTTMAEYIFKSGAAPHNTKRVITSLKSNWTNKQACYMSKVAPFHLIQHTICIFMSWYLIYW